MIFPIGWRSLGGWSTSSVEEASALDQQEGVTVSFDHHPHNALAASPSKNLLEEFECQLSACFHYSKWIEWAAQQQEEQGGGEEGGHTELPDRW
jgi:hypothetical protein